ncbi:MAG: beta-phosphoglucomutase [bacterium]
MIQAIIFDLDGVLVSTDDLHFQAWKQIADIEGIPFTREDNHRLRGVGRMESLMIILEKAVRKHSFDEKKNMADKKNNIYRESLSTLTPSDILPGAREILEELRQNSIKTAIGSSSKNAMEIMHRTALLNLVDVIIDGNAINETKPSPEVFLKAAQRLGVNAEECLVIEDAMAGIEAGRRAGMAVFGIGTPQTLPGVKYLAKSLADVTVNELLLLQPE